MAGLVGELGELDTPEEVAAVQAKIEALPKLPGGAKDLPSQTLGADLVAELIADRLEDQYIQFLGMLGYVWIVAGEEAAERWYVSGGRPEALRPTNRAARRAAGKSNTGAATKTPRPVSSSGTRSLRKPAKPTNPATGRAGKTS
jgi:hypothetical protein